MSNSLHSRRRVLQVTGVAVGSSVLIGTASADDHEIPESYSVELTGGAETHEVKTNASGVATFEADFEACEIHYTIDVEWLCDATQAHIHYGSEGEDGPVVAQLYPEDGSESKLIEGRFDGTLAEGTLTTDDFEGKFADKGFKAIAQKLAEEGAYVNIHTESYPEGELRGQVVPGEAPPTPDDSEEEEEVDEEEEDDEEEEEEKPEDEEEADEEEEEPEEEEETDEEDEEPNDEEEEEEETADDEEEEEEEPETVTTAGDATLTLGEINVGENVEPDDEYVTLQNEGDATIDFTGWTMQDRRDEGIVDTPGGASAYSFPSGFTLEAGAQVQVYTGGSESDNSDDVLYWGIQNEVWSQEGDTVIVEDGNGDVALEESYEGDGTNSIMGGFLGQLSSLFA
ncbi:CHRD domain-containing protein [Natronococcus sp. A-GB1]|uniref:CHRD domain-containing protein n=1 Tax=Natronococcus sp. A-GB1 TaxID=3037648 RepID=UPI00241D0E12|nr:CHRD domain-containing protein [Natronococcus sp. A-GB1]MDG5761782.1 CHRD domain-containing protein [Natronococcus sp. A-GB1]